VKQKKKTRAGQLPAKLVTTAPLKDRSANTPARATKGALLLLHRPEHWTAAIKARDLIAAGVAALKRLPPEMFIEMSTVDYIAEKVDEILRDLTSSIAEIPSGRRVVRQQKVDPASPADFVNGTPRFAELTSAVRIPEKVEGIFEAMAHLELAARVIDGLSPDVKIGDFESETLAGGLRAADEYVALANEVRRLFVASLAHSVDGYTGRSGDAA
jgi:hypothetical protein